MLKVEDALHFIRQNDQLSDWTDLQILNALRKSIHNFAFAFTTDGEKLTGLVFGRWEDEGETFHASLIIGDLLLFVKHLREFHPNVSEVTGWRNDCQKFVRYKIGKDL